MKKRETIFEDKIIDCHTHSAGIDFFGVARGHLPFSQNADSLSNELKNNNIDYAITFPFPNTTFYNINSFIDTFQFVPSGLSKFPFEQENFNLINQLKHFKINNLLPFLSFSLNSHINAQVNSLQTLIKSNYIYGLKYHTYTDQHSALDILNHPNLIDCIKEHDLPILIHSGQQKITSAVHIYNLAKFLPDVRICVAHLGRFDKKFWELATKDPLPNLFVDTSPFINLHSRFQTNKYNPENTIDCDTKDMLKALVYIYNLLPNNLLWGTDSPYTHTEYLNTQTKCIVTYKDEVNLLNKLKFHTIKKIASQNTFRFLFGNQCNQRN